MFVSAEAAVLMVVIMIMLVSRVCDGQRQQGKWQSEQQTAHEESPEVK
jgi:hypothetical protein